MGMVTITDKIPSLAWGKLMIWLENRPFTKLIAVYIYEARYCVLFSLSCWGFSNHCASCCALSIFRKLSMSRGALAWFETVWSDCVEAIDYWIIFSMKIKSNQNWKLYWDVRVFLVLLESPRRVRFNGVYFTMFRAKVWKILIFEWILWVEIQINYKNWVWKEKSVEHTMCSHCWI
jgi:hypothetical protein